MSEVSQPEMLVLNGRLDPSFEPDPSKGYITLGTHNAQVDTINEAKLGALETPLFEFKADIQGDFPERSYPTDSRLRLKVGAQVMFLKNNKEAGVYNGSIGRVTELDDNRVVVTMPDEKVIVAQKYVWRNIRYTWDKEAHRVREEWFNPLTIGQRSAVMTKVGCFVDRFAISRRRPKVTALPMASEVSRARTLA